MTMENILIIDDSPIDARIASKILTEAGYSTTIIHDGLEALGLARQLQPDLILLDVTMPKIDGYQVCRQLKADPDTRNIFTALYTIRDQFIDCLKGIEAGADHFIIKTLNGEDFLHNVRKILEERRMGLSNPAGFLDLNQIRPLVSKQDRHELIELLYSAFNRHVREAISVILGAHVFGILVGRAIEKTMPQFPLFCHSDQPQVTGLLFSSQAVENAPAVDLIEGFQAFTSALYQLVTKLTRTHVNGVKEGRVINRAFNDMVKELHTKYAELEHQLDDPGSSAETQRASAHRPETAATAQPLSLDCTLDANGHLIYWNDDLVRLLGYSKAELIGQSFRNLLTDESAQILDRAMAYLIGKGTAQPRLELQTRNGALIYADAQLTALYDPQGRFAMVRGRFQVIPTSRLLQSYQEENEKLKRALHSLNEEFSTLASTISHDLRQPLHAILMLSQFLENEYMSQLDEPVQEYFRSIQQAGTRMKELIEDVVHYARVISDSAISEEIDLNQLLEEVREECAAMLAERGASLRVMDELPAVICDRGRFKELLTELISNGVKFNDQAQPQVEVGIAKTDPDSHTFYVKDNGIGIEEPYHESIFRLFHRLHKPEEYGGTGAGLAVCRRIIESHGGHIWVYSQLGDGATFFFTLPHDISFSPKHHSASSLDISVGSPSGISLSTT